MKRLKVGDKVTSDFYRKEIDIIRTVTGVFKDNKYSSGYGVAADGGAPCELCNRCYGTPISRIDSEWFQKVKK